MSEIVITPTDYLKENCCAGIIYVSKVPCQLSRGARDATFLTIRRDVDKETYVAVDELWSGIPRDNPTRYYKTVVTRGDPFSPSPTSVLNLMSPLKDDDQTDIPMAVWRFWNVCHVCQSRENLYSLQDHLRIPCHRSSPESMLYANFTEANAAELFKEKVFNSIEMIMEARLPLASSRLYLILPRVDFKYHI